MRPFLAALACVGVPLLGGACSKQVIIQQVPATDDSDGGTTAASLPTSDAGSVNLASFSSGVDTPFVIPPNALGFNVTIEGRVEDFDSTAPYGIERITDPNGKIVMNDFTPVGGSSVTSTAEFDTIAAASIPQGEATFPIPGTWLLRVGVQDAPTKKITVSAKIKVQTSDDGQFHGGKLDLHLHIPDGLKFGATTIKASAASTSPDVAARVDKYFATLSQLLQIDRGDVVFHVADPTLASIDGSDALLTGFAASAGMPDGTQALHILYTNQIALNGKPIAAGISPGIPSAATIFGRGVSTIIIATSSSADFDALAMAHETGHFMGLNHTTEFTGGVGDPLSDTPLCGTLRADPPSIDQMKACPDRKNIMFPATPIEAPSELSPEQIRVYHGSPIYKAYTSAAQQTHALVVTTPIPADYRPQFRLSGGSLSSLEAELSLGFCGLNKLDAPGIMKRYGPSAADQLRAAAADPDLSPIIRGRAGLALEQLGL
jgi:hypothetical protein